MTEHLNPLPHQPQVPEFIVVFDGFQPEINTAEQRIASTRFAQLVDWLVATASRGQVAGVGGSEGLGATWQTDKMQVNLTTANEDALRVRAPFEDDYPASATRTLTLSLIDDDGALRQGYHYETGDDETVRRHDLGDCAVTGYYDYGFKLPSEPEVFDEASQVETVILDEVTGDELSGQALQDYLVEEQAHEKNERANADLEAEMRLNHQPVGLAEVEGLNNLFVQTS